MCYPFLVHAHNLVHTYALELTHTLGYNQYHEYYTQVIVLPQLTAQ